MRNPIKKTQLMVGMRSVYMLLESSNSISTLVHLAQCDQCAPWSLHGPKESLHMAPLRHSDRVSVGPAPTPDSHL